MFGFSTAKLIAFAVAAAAILSFVLLALHWKSTMEDRDAQLATICASVRAAANNPKMGCKAAPQQIGLMGTAIADLKTGIADRNAKIVAQGKETVQWKQIAAEASLKAQGRANEHQKVSAALVTSARSPERLAKPCEPSATLVGAWK